MTLFIINLILALAGICITRKISSKKLREKQFVCYVGGDCENVLSSKFSKFLGINIEKIGLLYYSVLFLGYIYLLAVNPAPVIIFGLFVLNFIGLIFSLYLTFVQLTYLRKWCLYCLASAFNTIIMFTVAMFIFSDHFGVLSLYLAQVISVLNVFQVIGIAVGLSSATVSGVLVIKFLKDFKIDPLEDKKLAILDQIIWSSIIILLVVNLCYYIADLEVYFHSTRLLAQFIILLILVVNDAFLGLCVNPKLIGVRMDLKSLHVSKTLRLRQAALALGVISIVSWYAVLFVSFFIQGDIDIISIISHYLAITIAAVVISQSVILLVDKIKITSDNTYKFK